MTRWNVTEVKEVSSRTYQYKADTLEQAFVSLMTDDKEFETKHSAEGVDAISRHATSIVAWEWNKGDRILTVTFESN